MRIAHAFGALILLATATVGCTAPKAQLAPATLDSVAQRYVVLVLQLGRVNSDDVDAYFGPDSLKAAAMADSLAPRAIADVADSLRGVLGEAAPGAWEPLVRQRHAFLRRQLEAVAARAGVLAGDTLSFDAEARALYDMRVSPTPDSVYDAVLARMEALVPGPGPLWQRIEAFEKRVEIPPARLDTVLRAAIAECRRRTLEHLRLPAEESFTVEYVKDVPWSGYNWFEGGSHSRIQVNITFPLHFDRVLDLACHEGYPGHHVYNVLLEQRLVRERGWVELTVYPLRTPLGPIAEGTAVVALEVTFPANERERWERDVLFPMAGLDTALYARARALRDASRALSSWSVDNAREYLDGRRTREQALAAVVRYGLRPPEQAERSVRFAEVYRAYTVNYTLGRDLVLEWLASQTGASATPAERWKAYLRLLGAPTLPHDLRADLEAAKR